MPLRDLLSELKLSVDGRIALHERQIRVGGCRCEDLDYTGVLQAPKAPDNVAVEAGLEGLQHVVVPMEIKVSQVKEMLLATLLEAHHILSGRVDLLPKVLLKMLDDKRVGQLLGKHRRDTQRHPSLHPRFMQIGKRFEQRQIRLRHYL